MRPSMYDVFHDMVQVLSTRSTCSARAAVGALLFDDQHRIYGTGYNGSPVGMPHCDDVGCLLDKGGHCQRSVHAEVNAILQCARMGRSTEGLRLFCTHSPCLRCATIVVQAGIVQVIYVQEFRSDFDDVFNLFIRAGVQISHYS